MFDCIFELERKGKSIKNHVGDHKISKLAGYGKSIVTLFYIMPESVKAKFAKDLTDTTHWINYLFEIESAWQFSRRDGLINWHEKENSPDFTVNFPEIEFDVECKRITVDAARKVHQKDFYRLSDKLIPKLADKYKGSIAIELDGRLSSDVQELNKMSFQIEKIISDNKAGSYDINPSAKVFLDLQSADGRGLDSGILNKIKEYSDLKTFYTVFAKNEMNPICLAIKSKKSDDVLGYIKDRMKDATKKQLKPDRPSLLFFFLEGISDNQLSGLEIEDSGIFLMSKYLFTRDDVFSNVIGIVFAIEESLNYVAVGNHTANHISSRALFFNNPFCVHADNSQRIYSIFNMQETSPQRS